MEITGMTAAHVAQVAALEKVCFSDPWSQKSVASELENPLALWLVAMDGERLVGYGGSQTVLGEADMMNVAVDPEYRRQGVAGALVTALAQRLAQQGNVSLMLEVRASNVPAMALYQKLGFEQVGRRKDYYRNPKEDALILKKLLCF